MTSLLGVNYALDHTLDTKDRDSFHRALNPAYSVAMVDDKKDIAKLQAFGQVNKDTIMVGRVWHDLDGGFHLKPTGAGDENKEFVALPEDYMNDVGTLGDINTTGYIYVMNEPNTNTDPVTLGKLSTWSTRWMDIAILKRRKSVMWNFGDRQPMIVNGRWQDWCYGHLKRMALYPNLFMIGMHLYGPDGLTDHVVAYEETCKFLGITPIPILVTEFGVDTDAGSAANGWRSRYTGKQYSQWIDTAIHGELAPFIKRNTIKGFCIFGWNNAPEWKAFDFQEDDVQGTDFKTSVLLIDTQQQHDAPLVSTNPFPADFATRSVERYVKSTGTSTFIRIEPKSGTLSTGIIMKEGTRCDIILEPNLLPVEVYKETIGGVEGLWLPVKTNSSQGWVFSSVITTDLIADKTITGDVPVVKVTEPILSQPPAPIPSPVPVVAIEPVKKFQWTMIFEGTDEDNRKALEGINLISKNSWKVESVEVLA